MPANSEVLAERRMGKDFEQKCRRIKQKDWIDDVDYNEGSASRLPHALGARAGRRHALRNRFALKILKESKNSK